MIRQILKLFVLTIFIVFSGSAFSAEVDFSGLLDYINTLHPIVNIVLTILGSLVVVGSAVDKIIPDEMDKGFMGKILGVPILGSILKALQKFSPFNYKQ